MFEIKLSRLERAVEVLPGSSRIVFFKNSSNALFTDDATIPPFLIKHCTSIIHFMLLHNTDVDYPSLFEKIIYNVNYSYLWFERCNPT